MHFHRSFEWTLGALVFVSLAGCDEHAESLAADDAEVVALADEDAAARDEAPRFELSEEDGLHHFAAGDGPVSAMFQQDDEEQELQITLAEAPSGSAAPPTWCEVGKGCSWCDTPCALPWPLGGMYIYYGNIIWQNNACYCSADHVACEWVSGCAG